LNAADITVIVPVHNRAGELKVCLGAIIGNDPAPGEVIVVDDGSTDDSARVAEELGCRVIRIERRGASFARNTGARNAQNGTLMFVDSDIEIGGNDVARLAESFENEDLRAAFTIVDDEFRADDVISDFYNLTHHYIFLKQAGETRTCYTSFFAVRKDLFLESGGFDDSWEKAVLDDVVLGWRLLKNECRLVCREDIRVRHHKKLGPAGFVRNRFRVGYEWFRAAARYCRMTKDRNFSLSDMVVSLRIPVNVLLVTCLVGCSVFSSTLPVALLAAAIFMIWNLRFFVFLGRRRGPGFAALGCGLLLIESLCFTTGLTASMATLPCFGGAAAKPEV